MKNQVGLWIDHRKAVIVSLTDNLQDIREIQSHMEKHTRYSGMSQAPAEDQRDRKFNGHLDKYYEKVVSCIRHADAILILGPGEAKGELKARLDAAALGGLVVGIEAVDKMTDHQIAAKVRERFLTSTGDSQQSRLN